MNKYKLKYMEIPKGNVKPMDYFFNKAIPGETYIFTTAKEVEDLVRDKFKEGWKYVAKDEDNDSYILYFSKEI